MWWIVAIGLAGGMLIYSLVSKSSSAAGVAVALPAIGNHARAVGPGYVLSDMIDVNSIPAIVDQGIKLVISLVQPDLETIEALSRAGITHAVFPLGAQWRHGAEIRRWAAEFAPAEILIHCTHGVDRSGNVLAHLLVTRHGWPAADAFYAVVYPTSDNVVALAGILAEFGVDDRRSTSAPGVGIFSLQPLGLQGGMKAVGEFGEMIRGNLQEISEL